MVAESLIPPSKTVRFDPPSSQHTGRHSRRVPVIADGQNMAGMQAGRHAAVTKQPVQLHPLRLQHARLGERLRRVRIQTAERHVHRAREMPGGKVGRGSQVENAAPRLQRDVADEALRQ